MVTGGKKIEDGNQYLGNGKHQIMMNLNLTVDDAQYRDGWRIIINGRRN